MTELEITDAGTSRERRAFRAFVAKLYQGDTGWVASGLFLLDIFLNKKDSFCRECFMRPLMVCKDGNICAECILIIHPGLASVLQVAFFEALPDRQDAVNLLLDEARATARQHGCREIAVGLNGHLAYGVGIMTGGWGRPTSFDTLYHKPYYAAYFRTRGLREYPLATYQFDPNAISRRYGKLSRAYRQFTFRTMDRHRWRKETELFGDLANRSLNHTRYYFERPPYQLYELLRNMKFFMKPEHLIFILKDGKEVGFIFWHPDFNEVLRPGKTCTMAGFGLRHLLRRKAYQTVKVNAIGLLPEYRLSGAAMGLFMTALSHTDQVYARGETNFVWDCNEASRRFNLSMGGRVDRTYAVFSATLEGTGA